jgi:hypothetical protein
MRTVLVSSSFDIATTINKVFGESFEIFRRVEHGLFQMVQESLRLSVSRK